MLKVLDVSGICAAMSLCINPNCTQPDHPGNDGNRFCQSCGSVLVLQNRFRVMRLLSKRSGFGSVYEVYERNIPKLLKILKPAHNHNAKAVQLFQQEARVLSELRHSGVPAVDSEGYFKFEPANSSEPLHCLVMEKIDGPNLREWMRQQGNHPISEVQARKWLLQIAQILHLVHQKNYFHRDIKPENIMLRSNGQLVLVDFGAARAVTETYMAQLGATGGMTRISSAGYTPPEQEKGQAVPQSDFYALGWTFIYLLTGKQPLDHEMYDAMRDAAEWRRFAPQVSPAFADLIDHLIAPKAVNRPQDTRELLRAIADLPDLETSTTGNLQATLAEATNGQLEPLSDYSETLPLPNPPVPSQVVPSHNSLSGDLLSGDLLSGDLLSDNVLSDNVSAKDGDFSPSHPPHVGLSETVPLTVPLTEATPASKTRMQAETLPNAPKPEPLPKSGGLKGWRLKGAIAAGALVIGGLGLWIATESGGRSLPGRLMNVLLSRPAQQVIQPEAILEGHTNSVNSALFTASGDTLISAGADRKILVWDLATNTVEETLEGHEGYINALALDGSGRWLASGDANNILMVWNLNAGELVHTLEGHTSHVNTLEMSPNGILASGSADKTVRIWDLGTGENLQVLEGVDGFINDVSISPNGQVIAAAGAAPEIVLWDLDTGEELQRLSYDERSVHAAFNTILFSPDSFRLIAAGSDKTIFVWDIKTGELEYQLPGHEGFINDLMIHGNGNLLLSSDSEGWLHFWDLQSQLLLKKVEGDGGMLDHITVRSDWRMLASRKESPADLRIFLWDLSPVTEEF